MASFNNALAGRRRVRPLAMGWHGMANAIPGQQDASFCYLWESWQGATPPTLSGCYVHTLRLLRPCSQVFGKACCLQKKNFLYNSLLLWRNLQTIGGWAPFESELGGCGTPASPSSTPLEYGLTYLGNIFKYRALQPLANVGMAQGNTTF